MYITSYVDGKKGVETLDGFSNQALDYIEDIYENYYSITGYDGTSSSSDKGSWWGDIEISSKFNEESDTFDAVLSINYRIRDYYENGDDLVTYDLYALTLDLNSDNKFDITETYSYENIDSDSDYFDGTSVFFDFWGEEEVTSLNLKTGKYNAETLIQNNLDFYLDEEDSYLDELQQTDNYGLLTGIRNKDEFTIVENIDTEDHSVLFEAKYDGSGYTYIDDITENKYGTLNVIGTNYREWTYSEDNRIQTSEENYNLYTYTKNGSLNTIDLGTYEIYYEYGNNWNFIKQRSTNFFLWNDNDSDTWLVKEYYTYNYNTGDGYSFYEGFVLDNEFDINNEADLTLQLENDEDLNNSIDFGGSAATNGFHMGFIFSPTEAEYDYEQERAEKITSKIQEANSWDKINYKTYDWSNVNYDSLSDYETEKIKWTKVDLELALKSDNFRFDVIDWKEIKNEGGVNTKKAYKLINDYLFDDDDDDINLKYLTSVEKIQAGGGNDSISGNSLNNIFYGQDGNDIVYGGSGKDKLYGGDDDDKLYGGTDSDTLYGEDGEDYLKGHSGNDTLHGGEGDDQLKGGTGKDKLYGASGGDLIYGEDGDDYIKGHSGNDTLYGGEDDDELKGGSGKDKLYGGADSDTLYGEDGDDYLKGHSGNDTLHGGEGDDHLKGGTGKDKLYGASGGDLIYGEDGDDYIKGHSGADTLYGGKDDDTLIGGSSSDNLYGGSGKDLINGESGNDYLKGHSGDDTLHGGEGDDKLKGGTGKDKLYGASGGDLIYGEDGDDYIKGHSGADTLYGGKDDDTLIGGSSSDNLYGGADSDTLYGESGNDYLKGHSGVDKLYGGKGNDTLIGGEGKDEIYGGSGDDTFKLTSGTGYDRIRDFEKGEDRIYIKGIDDLRVVDTGKHSKIYDGSKDLLAIIYNEDDLSISGNYLI